MVDRSDIPSVVSLTPAVTEIEQELSVHEKLEILLAHEKSWYTLSLLVRRIYSSSLGTDYHPLELMIWPTPYSRSVKVQLTTLRQSCTSAFTNAKLVPRCIHQCDLEIPLLDIALSLRDHDLIDEGSDDGSFVYYPCDLDVLVISYY